MRDIDWAVGHVKKEWPEVPVFLMGHSMVRTSSILSTDKDIKGRGCRVVV